MDCMVVNIGNVIFISCFMFISLSIFLQTLYKLSTRSLQTLYKVSTNSLQGLYKLSTRSLQTLYKLSTRSLQGLYNLSTSSLQAPYGRFAENKKSTSLCSSVFFKFLLIIFQPFTNPTQKSDLATLVTLAHIISKWLKRFQLNCKKGLYI